MRRTRAAAELPGARVKLQAVARRLLAVPCNGLGVAMLLFAALAGANCSLLLAVALAETSRQLLRSCLAVASRLLAVACSGLAVAMATSLCSRMGGATAVRCWQLGELAVE